MMSFLLLVQLNIQESGCSSGWYKISYNGTASYVCSSYVSTSTYTVKVDYSSSVNIRNGAGTNYSIYTKFYNDKLITLSNTSTFKGTGCDDGWYSLNYNTSKTKYICSTYTDGYNNNSNVVVSSTSGVNVREDPTTSAESIVLLKYGQGLTLDSTTTYTGSGCSGGWYKVYYQGQEGYVCSTNVTNTKILGRVSYTGGVSVREKPTTSSNKVNSLVYQTTAAILDSTKYSGSGCSGGWYKISLNGKERYVCSMHITTSDISTSITVEGTNIRTGAGTNYSKITSLSKNDTIYLVNTTKYSGSGCSGGWYKVNINLKEGYVCSSNTDLAQDTSSNNSSKSVTKKTTSDDNIYYTTNKWTYRINEDYAGVLTSPTGTRKELIYLGTEVKPLSTSGNFTKISYYDGKTGYVLTRLIDKYDEITLSNSSYCDQLKDAGFPESYCPYLSYLHSKYPNWIFKADNTGISFNDAVDGESKKNYTQIEVDEYLDSWTVQESGSWRTASDAYNTYMIDPRNYLTEKNIFVFEDLGYDSTNHTTTVVRSILDGTYLDTNTYAGYFISAGKTYDISPVHLAARVKQEGGSNSSYDAVSGNATETWNVTNNGYICSSSSYGKVSGSYFKVNSGVNLNVRSNAGTNYSRLTYSNGNYITINSNDTIILQSTTKYTGKGCDDGWYKVKINKSLKGIYNYYNIGAYGTNPVLRGLAVAAGYVDNLDGTPWNSREKAIKYGAKFIADGYINAGQDTMYYQKFNTGPDAIYSSFTHQYMTNILAPASESLSTYYSYDDLNILQKALVFKIPVYDDMPTEITSHPPVGGITDHLNNLK